MSKGFTLVELLVVIAIIAALAAMATPVILKQKKKADMTEAVNNAKQIFYLMVEFDSDYGEFPSAGTFADTNTTVGTASNDFLSQFVNGGYTNSEEIFFAKGGSPSGNKKPDNVITSTKLLEPGECGFAYVEGQSTSNNSGRAVVVAPFDTGVKFKQDPYDGKAVALRIDGAVKQLLLDKTSSEPKVGGGKTVFQTGTDTVWGSDTVTIAKPD